jgi:hypothetical protein
MKPKPTRVEELLETLLAGPNIEERVKRGVVHLRKHRLLEQVGISDSILTLQEDEGTLEDFHKRMKVKNDEEAYQLGFTARRHDEERFLVQTWKRILRREIQREPWTTSSELARLNKHRQKLKRRSRTKTTS